MQLREPRPCVRPVSCHQVNRVCAAAVCPVRQEATRTRALDAHSMWMMRGHAKLPLSK